MHVLAARAHKLKGWVFSTHTTQMAQLISLLGEQPMGDWNEEKCRVFLHQRKHPFWRSAILVTGITKTSVCACGSLSIPVVSTDLSVPQGAALMLLKNGQNQRDPWSARSSSRRSPSVFASGVYTSSEEEFCISVFPAGLWVLPPPLITQVTFSFLLLCFLFLPN